MEQREEAVAARILPGRGTASQVGSIKAMLPSTAAKNLELVCASEATGVWPVA